MIKKLYFKYIFYTYINMNLILPEIDYIIISNIFNGYYKDELRDLKNILLSFGKSKYNDFIKTSIDYFFNKQFKHFKVDNIYLLLQKITRKNNIKHFPCYNKFCKNKDNQDIKLISFDELKAKHRLIIYYISLYNGYVWVCTKTKQWESFGYEYWDFYDDNTNWKDKNEIKTFKYSLLKKKRIHNLKYYNLVERAPTLRNSLFKFKTYEELTELGGIYKKGVTKESKDIECIKIL